MLLWEKKALFGKSDAVTLNIKATGAMPGAARRVQRERTWTCTN